METPQPVQQEQPIKVSAESLGILRGEEYEGDLEFDLGNLMATGRSPLDTERFKSEPDAACLEVATQITQSLIAQLFQLPSQAIPEGRVADLPEPVAALPRAKPLPKPREPTKWELFAQRKGITKGKRSKDVWDEEAGEYKRRFGYKRAGDESEVPIIEAHASDQIGEDPFTALQQEKRERVNAQRQRQVANIRGSSKGADVSERLPPTLKLAAGLPAHGRGKLSKRQDMQDDIKAASKQAGVSTASMGKFDARLPGEKPGERSLGPKRKAVGPVAAEPGQEGKQAVSLVDRILRERADDIIDMDKAVRRVEAERHHQLPASAHEDSNDDEGKPKGKKDQDKGKRVAGAKHGSSKGERFAADRLSSAPVQDSDDDDGKPKGKKGQGQGKRGMGAKHGSSKGQRFAAIKRSSGGKQKGGVMKAGKGSGRGGSSAGRGGRGGAKSGGRGRGRK